MAILNQAKSAVKKIAPEFLIGGYHFLLALSAAVFCRFPSRKLKVIGVTGTNGKSTTAMMIARILEEAGRKTALSCSIEFRIGNETQKNQSRMTMPGRFALQKFLRDAVAQNCQYAVIEVSSEGIKQHRHRFIDFAAAVITNVTPEHIESHGSFEKYRAAKGGLFASCRKIHILNADDANYDFFSGFFAPEKYAYGIAADQLDNNRRHVRARRLEADSAGSSFEVGRCRFDLRLPGEFNIYNALAAICAAQSQNIAPEICQRALAKIEAIPGRMEKVVWSPFEVFVDYAVTPDSLEKAYQTMMSGIQGKLICVLGSCGGGRDKWKRPVMGNLAKKYCDLVFITNEDPYDEDPLKIINEIAGDGAAVKKIVDRQEAIGQAIKSAKSGDRVIVTGKGCEESMCVAGGKKLPWSDRNAVLKSLAGAGRPD